MRGLGRESGGCCTPRDCLRAQVTIHGCVDEEGVGGGLESSWVGKHCLNRLTLTMKS